jgi:predicted RNase H-related nuclease YkuK (DUF458 family)
MLSNSSNFFSPTQGPLSMDRLLAEIAVFVQEDPTSFYRLVIGSDSQIKRIGGRKQIDFVTAIVIHRQGSGARYFWQKEKRFEAPVLREKIYTETFKSLRIAHELVPNLREILSSYQYDLEIHIDVGPKGQTREMIKEVVGMVNGNGFVAKTKPDSWGASSVADKHT